MNYYVASAVYGNYDQMKNDDQMKNHIKWQAELNSYPCYAIIHVKSREKVQIALVLRDAHNLEIHGLRYVSIDLF